MQYYYYPYKVFLIVSSFLMFSPVFADQQATAIVKAAIDYWRDNSSYSVTEMIIHRTNWQRAMILQIWTQGNKKSLVRIIKPKKDRGNATLTKNDRMWTFSPKINRIIRIPASMMNRSWMGSDFSNNEVAKADELLKYYTHTLIGTETHNGQTVYIIKAVPFEYAPIVWGKVLLKIRADYIVLEQTFYDQDNILVKKMETLKIENMGGKRIAVIQRMQKAKKADEWTKIVVKEVEFTINVSSRMFTLSNLRNPRF
ncbi:MAG: outer membrane lipoprotein-sorting protein [Thiotrichaceae bacterium]|nr:outer membrane lipoprotein-sorting protein [Thiotrichaceae bacterium]